MRHALATAIVGIALTGCAIDDPEAEVVATDRFEYEPGLFVSSTPPLGKADLPNTGLEARFLDTYGYRTIADTFVAARYDVKRTTAPLRLQWPLPSSFSVMSRQGTPIRLGETVYEHTGLDIIRLASTDSPMVVAPVTGKAQVTDWFGTREFPYGDYSTVVSIWDPVTHVVVQVMHVKPAAGLPLDRFFDVTAGQVIGELADIADIPDGKHIHVNVVDAEKFELLDPVTAFPTYPDTKAPEIGDTYLLDSNAVKHTKLVDGPMDLMVTVHDRDDISPRNLEIASIAFTARDQRGNVLGKLDRCQLSDAYEKLATNWEGHASTIRLIDFGNGSGTGGFWPSSDVGISDKTYRYALTNMRNDGTTCSIVAADRDGNLTIGPGVTTLTLDVEVWDGRGNRATKQLSLAR